MPGSSVPQGAVEWLPLRRIIFRWIQGFHAALYQEFLDPAGHFVVQEPFPSGERPGHVYPIAPWHGPFVQELKRNRAAGRLDRLELPNGELRYHCVWVEDDNGIDLCIFALDLYGWSRLGDIHRHAERSCVGSYARSRPERATHGTDSKLNVANTCPLDAFADGSDE